ncbi:alpha/beta-hydrolase [Fomitiporia mediterranea MF3/22]|uniref:alpha/beta-hydrolase n=1 Tax=Fomitiporia mediterranea (strain MF3/22) TaxID=694068 RepID=UPI0004407919|nr:alpha/beta-hydrolase [Fomitiporia mediterranea MF3/22]EJD06707.1 alpha/beta-hydrolase [Fomitiporia mediterranea MF3/22]
MAFGTPKRIDVKYDAETVGNMLSLLKASPFPDRAPIDADTPWELGIEYEYLKKLRETFSTQWRWESLERKIAKFDNCLVHYEKDDDVLDLHFVHAKSSRSDAIPLILLHGWPGTFFDFHKVIEPLTNPPRSDLPAFHVVVPSLPGYFLSTLPRRDGWSLVNNAHVFNGLMTSVLGYKKYVGQGGDWGSFILRVMACLFPDSVTLMHFNMFRTTPVPNRDPSTFSAVEKRIVARGEQFAATGRGYNIIQSTKPFTIGIAIASSPLALLGYIGEKVYGWSDPERVDVQDILDTVALYSLSKCFPTSVMIYNQAKERDELMAEAKGNKWLLKNKFGFSAFPYESGAAPRCDIEPHGPLVYYKEHTSSGHFPALDSPNEFVDDLREFFGEHWVRA